MVKLHFRDIQLVKWCLFVLILQVDYVKGILEVDTSWPFYVEAGSNMTLVCRSNSGDRLDLFWERKTPDSGRQREPIIPETGGRFIIRFLTEEPSGYRESTLIMKNMTVEDRDLYYCMSDQHNFQVSAIVLEILTHTVVASPTDDNSQIDCDLVGFTTNTPIPEVIWYYNDRMISIYDGHKYEQRILDVIGASSASLIIKNTVREDTGMYKCSFLLGTTRGDFEMSKEIYLDASHQDAGTTAGTGLATPDARSLTPLLLAMYTAIATLM